MSCFTTNATRKKWAGQSLKPTVLIKPEAIANIANITKAIAIPIAFEFKQFVMPSG